MAQGTLNGVESLYLMVGQLQSSVTHIEKRLDSELPDLSAKVEALQRSSRRRRREPRDWTQYLGLSGRELFVWGLVAGLSLTGTLTADQIRSLLLGH